ncbi:SHOCT domain-containing protein [Dyadobacter psychrotolerans]|uniref:SHOCT domain-containing protein n=1 Tax=Dyadobacter psychrotolerans TaxID=2541721 RepID=A0A4R5DLJ5_9BACT|nr:SHOCT domain-containing protein [Dyadobacter psychrotolerans]TDE12851.1 SHOCT domain-containing protein [Dyadobacter psychrotolerans]
MKSLTKEGQELLKGIADQYNLQLQSVETMAEAVVKGNGTMAQFNIPELGGNGQWMKGGMTMVGDMFNNSLKAKVDKLCTELANLVSTKLIFEEASESSGSIKSGSSNGSWPSVFGSPTSSGAQNNFKYAYFGPARRLVIEEDGKRSIYDTKHHQISGISQQQGSNRSYQFTSQDGPVDLANLALISEPVEQKQETPELAYDVTHAYSSNTVLPDKTPEDIIISTIEKINILFEKGQITEEEFKTKKQELLSRL